MKIDIPPHSDLDEIPVIDGDLAVERAIHFIQRTGRSIVESAELALLVGGIAVVRFDAVHAEDNELVRSGWVVGGSIPHLELSSPDITTPMEALALYAYFFMVWCFAKGNPEQCPEKPVYWEPDTWLPAIYPFDTTNPFSRAASYISWKLIRANFDQIHHADIQEKCRSRGWVRSAES